MFLYTKKSPTLRTKNSTTVMKKPKLLALCVRICVNGNSVIFMEFEK